MHIAGKASCFCSCGQVAIALIQQGKASLVSGAQYGIRRQVNGGAVPPHIQGIVQLRVIRQLLKVYDGAGFNIGENIAVLPHGIYIYRFSNGIIQLRINEPETIKVKRGRGEGIVDPYLRRIAGGFNGVGYYERITFARIHGFGER